MVLATVYWHWAHSMAGNWLDDAHWCRIDAQWLAERAVQLRHYRRTGFVLVAIGVTINLLPSPCNGSWTGRIAGVPSYFNAAGTECAVSGDWLCVAVLCFWPQLSRFKLVLAIACVGRRR